MKKFLSTTKGRLAAVVLALIVIYAVSTAINHTVPFLILSGVKNGSYKPDRQGAVRLPWYLSFAAIDGIAIASRYHGIVVVLLPQEPASDANFTGLLVSDRAIPTQFLVRCASGAQCVSAGAATVASTPTSFASTDIAVRQMGRSRLYEARVDVED